MKTAIYGPGGFGRELILANSTRSREGVVFISDEPGEIGTTVEGAPVYSLDQIVQMEADRRAAFDPGDYGDVFKPVGVVIAVAGFEVRRKLAKKVAASGLSFRRLIAPTHIQGVGVIVGEGAILCDNTTITASAKIGRHFHANIYSYVAHDCVVGDFVTLAPRVCINGNTVIEDDAYIGTGAVLKQGTPDKPLRIGKGAVVGMGAVVTKDVAPGSVVVGNPARPLS